MQQKGFRTTRDAQVCQSKAFYDTEFEATLACARWRMDEEEMIPYRCPGTNHFHITHKERTKRVGMGFKYKRCPGCNTVLKSQNFKKHITKCKGMKNGSNDRE